MTTTAVGVGAVWAGEEQVQVHEGRRQEEEERGRGICGK